MTFQISSINIEIYLVYSDPSLAPISLRQKLKMYFSRILSFRAVLHIEVFCININVSHLVIKLWRRLDVSSLFGSQSLFDDKIKSSYQISLVC